MAKMVYSQMMKSGTGEGSRGGHVIGRTKSGKPVYASKLQMDIPAKPKGFIKTPLEYGRAIEMWPDGTLFLHSPGGSYYPKDPVNVQKYRTMLKEQYPTYYKQAMRYNMWRKQMRSLSPLFVRFGDVPKSGRSYNQREGTFEAGVSVYPAYRDPNSGTLYVDAGHSNAFALAQERTLYMVSGNKLTQHGGDDEVLLSNAARGKKIKDEQWEFI